MRNFSIIILLFFSQLCSAGSDALKPKQLDWSFDGIFGSVDRKSAQRGFQIYREVCSACHGLNNLYYRNLEKIGFTKAEIKEIASQATIIDGPNDDGEMFERPGIAADRFKAAYANEQAARASNNGAYPPDLSLIIKARQDGANYVYSLLTGYHDKPVDFKLNEGLYYNPYFPGKQIAMAKPLNNAQVEYMDNTPATIEQMSKDVVNFLQWAAEPEMEERKSMGLKVIIYLSIFSIFFYIANKRIWSSLKN